jgi:hypothetical protein
VARVRRATGWLGLLRQALIPSFHEGQNPLVIASEGARSLIGKERTLPREVGMMRRTIPLSVAAVLAVLALGSVLAPAASASSPPTCRVDNETQGTDFSSDTGQALTDAIAAAVPGDQLAVIGTCRGTYALDRNLTLTGISQKKFPTPTLDGQQAGTTLTVFGGVGVRVTLTNLTITGGSPGIENFGSTVTLSSSTVSGNTGGSGGGILNSGGTVTVTSSTVSGNGPSFEGGGIFNQGGTVTVTSSTVSGNDAELGGGISNSGGTVTVTSSTVSGNSGGLAGGGIFNNAILNVSSSAVSGNTADSDGGGIFNIGGGGIFNRLTVTSSTVSGNTAGSDGGGIVNLGDTGTVNLHSSIVSKNTAGSDGGGIFNFGGTFNLHSSTVIENTAGSEGGGIFNLVGTVNLDSSTVSGNVPDNCVNVPGC